MKSTLSEIKEEVSKEFEKEFADKGWSEVIFTSKTENGELYTLTKKQVIKSFLLQQIKKSYHKGIKDAIGVIPKDKVFSIRKDNPQYSLGQTNGAFVVLKEITTNLTSLLKKV